MRLLIAALAVGLTAWSQWAGMASSGDEWLRDRFIRLHTTVAPDSRILVVDVDENSLAQYGPWPWPRARLADLVEILLTSYASRAVGLDIVLPEAADADGDARLGLLARHGPLVLAQAFDYSLQRPQALREGRPAGAVTAPSAGAVPATGYIANQPAWADVPRVGNIGFIPDPDGALRRLPMFSSFEGRTYPALTLALINCCDHQPVVAPASAGLMRIDYRRDWNAYTVVSAADILSQSIQPQSARGRLVLIGSSSLGLGDRVTTPLAASRPGLGVQATMLSTLLDHQAGLAPPPWPGRLLALLFAIAVATFALLALPRLAAASSVALLLASCLLWLLVADLIIPHDSAFSPAGPLLSILFLLTFAVPYQWQMTQRRSRQLLDTLRQYVAPGVVQELLRSDLKDPLAPRQLDVTTLIADMEGYTTQVEALPVEDAAALTRSFLNCLTGPVMENSGTLDKYTGDGLVAFWGAPLPQASHADLALDAARGILRRVEAFSNARMNSGFAPLRVRIGIDSGLAMAGDFGTSFRSIYTAVGDSVNTASRLEQAARDFPHDIIVGAGTVERARRHQFIPLGQRLLRGKEKPTNLFTLDLSMNDTVSAVSSDRSTPGTRA